VAAHVTVGWHVLPDRQALLGSSRAGPALKRFLGLLGAGGDQARGGRARAAAAVPPGSDGLAVLDIFGDRATLEGIGADPSPALVWRGGREGGGRGGARRRGPTT